MAKGELLKKLFSSYTQGNAEAFRSVALEIITEEERKSNRVLANALRRSLGPTESPSFSSLDRTGTTAVSTTPGRRLEVVPHEKDKQLPLVDPILVEKRKSDIVLSRDNQRLLVSVLEEFRSRDVIRSHGLRDRSKLLFCGPPGCGKTLCAEVFAHEVHLPLLVTSMDTLVSSYLGETATNLRRIFDYVSARPAVLLLDEFDAIARLRDDDSQHGELKRVVNSLLQLIDRFSGPGFVIAATNHERQLDPAIWRRFDEVVYFAKPSGREIMRLLKLKFRNFRIEFDPAMKVEELVGFSHAEIERVCMNAIRRSILHKQNSVNAHRFQQALNFERRRRSIANQLQPLST
jgi:SpoVK/Ycf46/Vps4 family AAA+-type ATPase